MEYTIPRGVFDILPFEVSEEEKWRASYLWQHIEKVMRETALDYGFHEIRTPIFEKTELFVRGVGQESDIVSKEMYTFLDRGERSMTLRPEGTAPVIRAFVENNLANFPRLHKYFYIGPMFRYERPQAGRYRQHHQFGAEAIGIGKPEQDVELIEMACEIYRRLGLTRLTVQVNSVGDAASRSAYRQALSDFLTPQLSKLSADSQARFAKNMLRILDSKDPKDQEVLQGAPSILDHLTAESKAHFEQVLKLLDLLNIEYQVNSKLVRGLDYYNKTVFEITAGELGAQNSVGGGGRYDGLIKDLGGPDLPSVGFGTGIERLLHTLIKQGVSFAPEKPPVIFLIPIGAACLEYGVQLVTKLRHVGISAEIDLSGKKIQHGLQMANHLRAIYSLVIGEEELAQNKAALKHMEKREAIEVSFDQLPLKLKELMQSHV